MSDEQTLVEAISDAAIALDGIAESLEAFSPSDTGEIVGLIRDAETLANVLWTKLES